MYCSFIFKRGEIPISPTRESIEINNFTNDWIKGKFKIINKNYEKTINDYIDKLIDSNSLCSDIINKANSKVLYFIEIVQLLNGRIII